MRDSTDRRTIRAGLIGAHIGRSRFGMALSLLAEAEGLDLHFEAFDCEVLPDISLPELVADLAARGQTGLTVTHPFKGAAHGLACAWRYPDELGASNLLRFHDGGCVAHNTDYAGMRAVWRDRFGATPPGRVAIAGAGGVCRALVLALLDAGAERIAVWDLDPAKAEAVAAVSERVVPCDVARAGAEAAAATGLVNATPLGMHAYPGTAFDTDWLSGAEWAFDAVYTPIVTPFVAACRARGIETLTGFDLFRHMAVASFAIYADRPAPAGAADTLHALARGLD